MLRILTGIIVLAMVISGCGAEPGSSPADARSFGGGADLQALGVTEADERCAKAYATLKEGLLQESRPQDALALDGSAGEDRSSFDIAIRERPDPTYHELVNADDHLLQDLGITSEQAKQCRWSIGPLTLPELAYCLRNAAAVGISQGGQCGGSTGGSRQRVRGRYSQSGTFPTEGGYGPRATQYPPSYSGEH